MKKWCVCTILFVICVSSIGGIRYTNNGSERRDDKKYENRDENRMIYGYEYLSDVQNDKYPDLPYLCVEVGSYIYFVDIIASNSYIYKLNPTTGNYDTTGDFDDVNYYIQRSSKTIRALWYDASANRLYFFEENSTPTDKLVFYIDTTDDTVTELGSIILGTEMALALLGDVFKIGSYIYSSYVYADGSADFHLIIRKYDAGWATEDDYTFSSGNAINAFFNIVIGTTSYILAEESGLIYMMSFNSITSTIAELSTLASYEFPTVDAKRYGIAYDDSDLIYFIGEASPTPSGTYKLIKYSISNDSYTVLGTSNIGIQLDRNVQGTYTPYTKEKAFDFTYNYVFQIHPRRTGLFHKIADLTNITALSGYIIVAITDKYIFVYKGATGAVEIWQYHDVVTFITNAVISHAERNYPTAYIDYDDRYYRLEQDQFIQIFGVYKGSNNLVKFEGFVFSIEEQYQNDPYKTHLKRAELISYAYFDLKWYFPYTITSTGDTDAYLDDIDDSFNYITKGTYDDGGDFNTDPEILGKKNAHHILNNFGAWDQFTWYITPLGVLFYEAQSTSSGVTYDETDSIDINITHRRERINAVTVTGAYVNGAQITSTKQVDQDLIDFYGEKPITISIAWINNTTDANTMASSILALLKTSLIYCKINIRDTTNGMLQSGETITFSHTQKGLGSATFMINQAIHNDKTLITEYTISSGIRYELADFQDLELDLGDLSEQVGQVNDIKLNSGGQTASRALETDGSGNIGVSAITSTELGYLNDVTSNIQTQFNTILSYLGVGAGNAQWIPCPLDGGDAFSSFAVSTQPRNLGAADFALTYMVPLPPTLGGLSLYIQAIKLVIFDADTGDYVDTVTLYTWDSETTLTNQYQDTTNRQSQATVTLTPVSPVDVSGSERTIIFINVVSTDANDFDFPGVSVQYYYA